MAKSFEELANRTMTKAMRDRARLRTQELKAEMLLEQVRTMSGKTQQQLATALGIKQPSLSKLEKQADMQLSTLQRIISALGGELEVVAKFPKGLVRLGQFTQVKSRNSG